MKRPRTPNARSPKGDQGILDRFKERTIQEYEAEKELKQAKEQEEPEA